MRHLQKSIHYSLDDANLGAEIINWNRKFQEAVDECLVELSLKVREASPILDTMAVMLENISNITVIARTTIAFIFHTAQIIGNARSFVKENVSLDNKEKLVTEGQRTNNKSRMLNKIKSTYSRVHSIKSGRRQFNYEFFPKNSINGSLPELFNLPFLHNTTDRFEENNLYPFLHLLPDGNLFIFANRRSISFDYVNNRVVKEFPEIPGEKRNYPAAGSSVLLPLRGNSPAPKVMICGGAPAFAFYQAEKLSVYVAASKTCGRLKVTDPEPQWLMENMPMCRLMSDMILLPSGDVLIINDASNGTAGWKDTVGPVLNPVLYSPTQPNPSKRFTVLSPTIIPRMYHSTAILLPDGRILVGGSNPHLQYNFTAMPYPTELSLEAFLPPYMAKEYSNLRSSILTVEARDKAISYVRNLLSRSWWHPTVYIKILKWL
ncbi:hypothetical protein ACSBR2_039974 [Camellia fascicularis]